MIKEGIVTSVENGFATVIVKTHNACDACRAECGGHCDKAKLEKITVENTLSASKGDKVQLFSETRTVMLYAVLVFVLPIVCALLVPLVLSFYYSSALLLSLSSLFAFAAVFVILHFSFRNKKESDIFKLHRIIK